MTNGIFSGMTSTIPLAVGDYDSAALILSRPELIESLFVIYRITGDKIYQEKAWKLFESITKATQTEHSYSSIPDVLNPTGTVNDAIESFFYAETLKYFYLIFSEPNVISLDDYVFSTEAHPFRIPKPKWT
jgi:mannosyl-oligosaccharide alpha-1,2-mannosidase